MPSASLTAASPRLNPRRKLSNDERAAVYHALLSRSMNGKLPRGALSATAQLFQCHLRTVSRVWTRAQSSLRAGAMLADVSMKFKGNSGQVATRSPKDIELAIKAVSHNGRQTLRDMAAQSGIPKTTIVRHMKVNPKLKAMSSYSKPMLTDDNKVQRMKHALSFIPTLSKGTIFGNMNNFVHVDEKWFFLTTVKKRYYLYEDEVLPTRFLKSKRFITKVMFLAAVARPCYDHHKKCHFDGKIGVWPFVKPVEAKRNSKNRPKGTPLLAPESVNAEVYRKMIVDNVVPAIKAKMPRQSQANIIYLQQDNASPHASVTTQRLLERGVTGIGVSNQPPNSPDFNVLDLGYFNSIQSLQSRKCTRTVEELIDAVKSSFHELPRDNLSKNFISLQKVMEKTLEHMGRNDYKMPHMHKDATIKDLTLFNVHCDPLVLENAQAYLSGR
ncbi:hypothetical protein AaE_014255 [Aphanomyces astaci]|uniref:DUF7769 domain-containing protein n=1 Tax=Aphanomyces astaci TaxID=112090 RepID=A0A6A4Z848_APHAT|nr:hypothetical protein AaE_014255 [Aphanomyces astaci]